MSEPRDVAKSAPSRVVSEPRDVAKSAPSRVVSEPPRVAVAVPWGGVAALLVYAGLRAWQALFTREADPASVIWSAHSGYVWRMLIATYAGGMAAVVAYIAARRDVDRLARALPSGIVVAALAIAAQAFAAP